MAEAPVAIVDPVGCSLRAARLRWAELLRRIFEVDPLRRPRCRGPYASDIYHPNYDVAPDGRRFVMVRPAQDTRRLVMVVNWARELRQRLGRTR